jgi:hypothetical protein
MCSNQVISTDSNLEVILTYEYEWQFFAVADMTDAVRESRHPKIVARKMRELQLISVCPKKAKTLTYLVDPSGHVVGVKQASVVTATIRY